MTAPTTAPTAAPADVSDAQTYLAAVGRELADLPAEERGELLDDLAAHLAALEEEGGGDDRPYAVRLGPADDYAAELRAAAGLPARTDPPADRPWVPLAAVRRAAQQLSATKAGREVVAFLPLLVPAWWVLRGYLVVFLLALVEGNGLRGAVLLDVGPGTLVGLVLLVGAVVASVRLGRHPLSRPARTGLRLVEIVLVLWTLLALGASGSGVQYVYADDPVPTTAQEPFPLLSTSGPVTDVFPYSAEGVPLEGVLLYDQDGRPLRVGAQQWWADECGRTLLPPQAADGVPVDFSYPQRYVLDGGTLYGGPPAPGQCRVELPRPDVPLPVFPPAESPTESAADEPPADGAVAPDPATTGDRPAPPTPAPAGPVGVAPPTGEPSAP